MCNPITSSQYQYVKITNLLINCLTIIYKVDMWSLNKLINALFRTVLRYLFVHLLLKAIAAGQQISQKIEQMFLLDFCFFVSRILLLL